MINWLDPWSIFGILVVLLIAGWGIKLLRDRIEEQRYREEMEELAFEQSIITQISSSAGTMESDARFLVKEETPLALFPQKSPAAPLEAARPVHPSDSPNSSATLSDQLIARLQQGGLVTSIEGYLELHGDARGITIVRLRNGKTGLVVPTMESESFLRRNSRRADLIFMCGSDGNAYVVRRVEDVIAEML